MKDIIEYLASLGVAPLVVLALSLSAWFSKEYISLHFANKKHENEVDTNIRSKIKEADRALLSELQESSEEFSHCVNRLLNPQKPVFESGFGSNKYYGVMLESHYVKIRPLARKLEKKFKRIEPNFLFYFDNFTVYGWELKEGKDAWSNYEAYRNKVYFLFEKIGMSPLDPKKWCS